MNKFEKQGGQFSLTPEEEAKILEKSGEAGVNAAKEKMGVATARLREEEGAEALRQTEKGVGELLEKSPEEIEAEMEKLKQEIGGL